MLTFDHSGSTIINSRAKSKAGRILRKIPRPASFTNRPEGRLARQRCPAAARGSRDTEPTHATQAEVALPSPASTARRVGDQEAGPQLDGDCPGRRPGVHHALQEGRAGSGAATGRVTRESRRAGRRRGSTLEL